MNIFNLDRLINTTFKFSLICFIFSNFLSAQTTIPNSVVKIFSFQQSFDQRMPWMSLEPNNATGSGFVIEDNIILTNAHVVSNSKYIEIKKHNNPKKFFATIKYISHSSDIAILNVTDPSFFSDITPLILGDIPEIDSVVKTVGFPMGGEEISMTTGIISRIEKIIYSHSSADEHLAIQTDAAINPGNSGGPVLQNGIVVGMAFQGIRSGDNIGYMIPTSVIKHVIKDSKDNLIDGVPELGVFFNPLPPVIRKFLNMPENLNGIIVTSIHPASPVDGLLKKNDVITEINGNPILDDGTIMINGLKVAFYETLERSQYGDNINIKFFRDGQIHSKEINLKKFAFPFMIGSTYEIQPEYFILGGLTFVNLTGDYIHSFGEEWWTKLPPHIRLLYYYQTLFSKNTERKSFIVLSEVIASQSNIHAKTYVDDILMSVNGKEILCLNDLKKAFLETESDFYELRFFDNKNPLILEKEKVKEMQSMLMDKYDITKPYFIKKESGCK